MTTEELNNYIKNYLLNDKTQSAIMLTAPWGTGKSYYIKNKLCPFLKEQKLKFAYISLYGVSTLKDLNKNLFFEIKNQKYNLKKKNTAWIHSFGKTVLTGATSIGKTILKSISGIDIDLKIQEPNWQKLYDAVNLKDTLVILEDLERCSINTVELLGYVNNLVEQDNVKVLLVANENELIKKIPAMTQSKDYEKIEQILDENSKKYIEIKEKTISDTIKFDYPFEESVENIIKSFNNLIFNKLLEKKDGISHISLIKEIEEVSKESKCKNLRSIIFACQKTKDILDKYQECKNIDFIRYILLSNIAFGLRLKTNETLIWDYNDLISSEKLGTYKYPLYRFCYKYITNQILDITEIKGYEDLFVSQQNHQKLNTEISKNLNIIYSYYIQPESDVYKAIEHLYEKLKIDNGISHNDYVRIANYLITIKATFIDNTTINNCLKQMLINTQKAVNNKEDVQVYSSSGIQLITQQEISEFDKFKADMLAITQNNKQNLNNFDYSAKNVSEYYDYIIKNKIFFIDEGGFAKKLDIDKFVDLLKECSAKQLYDVRGIFKYIYMDISNIKEFLTNDLENLIKIRDGVDKIIVENKMLDSIQVLQLNWLIGDLNKIIEKLKGGQNG